LCIGLILSTIKHGWIVQVRASSPALVAGYAGLSGGWCAAQTASDDSDAIRGVVINSVTHDPIERALVFFSRQSLCHFDES